MVREVSRVDLAPPLEGLGSFSEVCFLWVLELQSRPFPSLPRPHLRRHRQKILKKKQKNNIIDEPHVEGQKSPLISHKPRLVMGLHGKSLYGKN